MKKILLLLTLITFSAFAQNPDYHRYGVRTPFTKYISYTTSQRDALTPTSTDRTIIHHKDTGINRLEQWDGDSWEELGGDGAVSSVNSQTGDVLLNADDISDTSTTNKFVTSTEKGLIATALQDAPIDGNEYVRKDGDWEVASGGSDDQTATEVPFTPYSTIAATNVQDAIEEVLDEIPTSLAAANITVSPSIGGNTDVYAVMYDHEDRISDLEGDKQDILSEGAFVDGDKTKLNGIETAATANSSDATLLNRANHTGTQTASTISDFDTEIANNTAVAANTAKVSFDSASSTKLSGIEAGAEVNDTGAEIVSKIDTELGGSDWQSIVSMPIEQKLKNWFNAIYNDPSNATLAFVGDSTSDLEGNASGIVSAINSLNKPGFQLYGFDTANMPNYGFNGQPITTFISDTGEKGLAAVAAADLDLVIFSYGINDVRVNNLTKDQLKAHIITCINAIKAGSPNTDIVLRMPNDFDIPVNDTYIKQGSYSSLAEAAQAQTNILYNAYKELEFYWHDVVLFNTQDLLFGRISTPTPSYLHTDPIHPRYDQLVRILVEKFIGKKNPFKKEAADRAIEVSSSPWEVYPRVFEKEPEYIKLGEGTLNSQGTGYARFTLPTYDSYKFSQDYRYGDYISINNGEMVITNTVGLSYMDNVRVQYGSTLPTNTFPNGTKVEFFRARYNNKLINKRYLEDKSAYPYARRVRIGSTGTNFLRIQTILDDGIITPITKGVTPVMLNMKTTDILVLNDGTVLPLTGATFSDVSNTKNIGITGNFTSYAHTVAFIYANKPYEDASVITGTGTVIDMSGKSQYNFASASSATTFTMTNIATGGYSETLINTASEPVVTGATKKSNSETWVTGTNMVLCVKDYNGTRKFWFEAY